MCPTLNESEGICSRSIGVPSNQNAFSISPMAPTGCSKYLSDTRVEITLEVRRNFDGAQVIHVAKLVSQCTSKGVVPVTIVPRSRSEMHFSQEVPGLLVKLDDLRPNEILVGRPAIRVGVEFALQRVCQ